MADYYQLLGIGPQASVAEIRQAYSRLAREKHPDRFQDADEKQKAQRLFQDITTAFNTLSNPRTRQEYDQTREKPQPKTPEEIAAAAGDLGANALPGCRARRASVHEGNRKCCHSSKCQIPHDQVLHQSQ